MLLKAPRWSLILVFQKDKQHSTQQSESDLYGKYLSDNYAPVLDELVSQQKVSCEKSEKSEVKRE